MKKYFYIFCFMALGVLLQFLVHAVIEVVYINLLIMDFARYGFGLSWETWYAIHYVGTFLLLIAGIAFGFWQGMYWWQRIYIDKDWNKK